MNIEVNLEQYILLFCAFGLFFYLMCRFYMKEDDDLAFLTLLLSACLVLSVGATFIFYPTGSENALRREAMTIYWKKKHEEFVMKHKMKLQLQKYKEKLQRRTREKEILRIYERLKEEHRNLKNSTSNNIQ